MHIHTHTHMYCIYIYIHTHIHIHRHTYTYHVRMTFCDSYWHAMRSLFCPRRSIQRHLLLSSFLPFFRSVMQATPFLINPPPLLTVFCFLFHYVLFETFLVCGCLMYRKLRDGMALATCFLRHFWYVGAKYIVG